MACNTFQNPSSVCRVDIFRHVDRRTDVAVFVAFFMQRSLAVGVVFRRVRKIARSFVMSAFTSVPVSLYVRMEQLGFQWTDFY